MDYADNLDDNQRDDRGADVGEDIDIRGAAFEIMRLCLSNDQAAMNNVFQRIFQTHGMSGMAGFLAALAAVVLDLTHLPTGELAARLDADPQAAIGELFAPVNSDGTPATGFDPDSHEMVVAGLRLLCVVAEQSQTQTARYLGDVFDRGTEATQKLISGLLMILKAVLWHLSPAERDKLLTYRPSPSSPPNPADPDPADDTEGEGDSPVAVFELPPGMDRAILATALGPDETQAATDAASLIMPMLVLHGEAATWTVCRLFAAALTDLLGLDTMRAVHGHGRMDPVFQDANGRPIDERDVQDPLARAVMLAYRFVVAYVNNDDRLQRKLIRTVDGPKLLITGLTVAYRSEHRHRRRQPQRERTH